MIFIGKQVSKALLAFSFSLSIFYCNSISSVKALDSLAAENTDKSVIDDISLANKDQQLGSPTSMTSVKSQIGSVQPSNLNLQQLPTLIDIPQTAESIEKVGKLEAEGEKLFQQRLLDKALIKWQEAYGLSLEMKYAEGEGRALTNMCRVFLDRGQYVKAKYMGENAIEILGGLSDKKALGRAHLYLAQAYFGLDNPVWAGQQLDLAMKSFTADGGNNAADTASLMGLAANIILNAGKLKEALQFLQASALYYGQAGDNGNAIASRIKVINVLLALGLYTAASEEAEKAISVARTAPDQIGNLTAALAAYANCKFAFGEYGEAKKIYSQVLGHAKNIPNNQFSTTGRASLYLAYGTTLSGLHDYSQAKQALDFALPIFKASGASLSQAQAANALGIVELYLGHSEKALELLQQALDLHNLITPKQDFFRNTVLQNLASVESRLGDNRQAKAHLVSAEAQQKKVKDSTNLGRTYCALAEVMLKLAEHSEAERYLNDAITLSQSVGDDSALWRDYTLLARIQLAQANTKAAHDSLLSAISFLRSPQSGEFSTPEHVYYPSERKEMAYQLMHLLVQEKLIDEALLISEQLKEEAFLSNWIDCNVPIAGPDAELCKDLALQRTHLHASDIISPPNNATKEWQNWLARFRALCTQNKRAAQFVAPIPISIADISKVFQGSRGLVLDYVLGKDSSIVFAISAGGKVEATILPFGNKQIAAQINSLIASFGHEKNEAENILSERLLHSLHSALIPESVRNLLPQNPEDLLMIVPDGALAAVPFGALLDNQNKYLILEHTVSLSPSLASLVCNSPSDIDNPGLLFVAGSLKADEQGNDLVQLREIAQNLPPTVVTYLSGDEANVRNLQEQGSGKVSIQVAGVINLSSGNGLESSLPLKKQDSPAKLADLFSVQLSCDALLLDTVVGDNADFNKGLNRNVMHPLCVAACAGTYAGARNNVMSLWAKTDKQNDELSEFYKGLLAGLRPASALRKAELIHLSHDNHPVSWAVLQIFGPLY